MGSMIFGVLWYPRYIKEVYNDKIEAEHLLQDKRASSWTGQRKALVKSDGKVCMLSNFHQFVGRFMTFGICL